MNIQMSRWKRYFKSCIPNWRSHITDSSTQCAERVVSVLPIRSAPNFPIGANFRLQFYRYRMEQPCELRQLQTSGEEEKSVAFVEFNSDRDVGKELCIGVCESTSEDPSIYVLFNLLFSDKMAKQYVKNKVSAVYQLYCRQRDLFLFQVALAQAKVRQPFYGKHSSV